MSLLDRPTLPPVLKWAGGKRWLIGRLSELYKRDRRLVDPFVGGASVPLVEQALLCDVNPHVMNLYRWLQAGLEYDDSLGIRFENDRQVYLENRAKFNALCQAREYWTKEGALLFYYLNRTCFNGLCRFNSRGEFNVPFGSYKNINYTLSFAPYVEAMKGWEMYSGDFASLPIQPDVFLYADPPFAVEFTQFAPRAFTWSEQERLAKWLADHKGPVVTSNQATGRILDLYKSLRFHIIELQAPRLISCNGDRTPAVEILAIKGV